MNGKLPNSQYKEHFSNFREWDQLGNASEYLIYPENIGPHLGIGESCLSSGEVHTSLTNKDGHGGPGTLVAVIRGTKAETVIAVTEKISLYKRFQIKEITLGLSSSMMLVARTVFPGARITNDRFHVQKLACDALQEMRIAHRWDAIQADTDAGEEAKCQGNAYTPPVLTNGDTHKQLPARSRYLLFKSADKWTESQKQRAEVLFETYPDLKEAYSLTHSLRMIFSKNIIKDAARLSLARWYNKVDDSEFKNQAHTFAANRENGF